MKACIGSGALCTAALLLALPASAMTGAFPTTAASPPAAAPRTLPGQGDGSYEFRLGFDPAVPRAGEAARAEVEIIPRAGLAPPGPAEGSYHLYLVSANLEHFQAFDAPAYEPPAAGRGARLGVPVLFSWGGPWCLIATFMDRGLQVGGVWEVAVEGARQPRTRWNFSRVRRMDDLEAVLRFSAPAPVEMSWLDLEVELKAAGRPVEDLEPFLGYLAHATFLREGALSPAHVHGGAEAWPAGVSPVQETTRGPRVYLRHYLPTAGKYRVFLQVRRAGRTILIPFDLWVEEHRDTEGRGLLPLGIPW